MSPALLLRRAAFCGAGLAGLAAASAATVPPRADRSPLKEKPTTYLVTGCSTGLGLELVRQLAARGDKVYATCRDVRASATGVDELSQIAGDVTIVPGIDVTSETVGETLKSALRGVKLDCIVRNAGGFAAPRAEQKLETISMDAMRAGFELNTLSVLRVTQALLPQLATPGGKLAVISSMIGSIDNSSGGMYAYRTSKAAVNMVSKSMANDLKPQGIAVVAISPGFVATHFGGMPPEKKMQVGAKPVTPSVRGIVEAIDALEIGNTGTFVHTNYGNGLQPAPW